jgi:hypothetical protein
MFNSRNGALPRQGLRTFQKAATIGAFACVSELQAHSFRDPSAYRGVVQYDCYVTVHMGYFKSAK